MATQDTQLAGATRRLLDGLERYRGALSSIRDELDRVGEIDVDARTVGGVTAYTRDLLDALQPLEMQLAAVARQQETLRTFAGIRVDFDAFSDVSNTARVMDETVLPLRRKLAEFEKGGAGLTGTGDIDRQLAVVDDAIGRLTAFAEADARLQAELDALEEPLRAHREAVIALQNRLESVVRARRDYGQSYTALRDELRTLSDTDPAPEAGGADLSGLTGLVERFEQARRAQLDALDRLGFDGLPERLTEFETARADQFPDFRNHRLDGLQRGVSRFDEVHQRHRSSLEGVELGDLERNLTELQRARARQASELKQLNLGVVLGQLFAIEQARGQQHNALSALSLGELEQRFVESLARIARINTRIAGADLYDPSTAPTLDEDEGF